MNAWKLHLFILITPLFWFYPGRVEARKLLKYLTSGWRYK
jgi:hypothetical protein